MLNKSYLAFENWYENLELDTQSWHDTLWEFADMHDLITDLVCWQQENISETFFESLERFIHSKMSYEWNDFISKKWEEDCKKDLGAI